MIFGRPKSPHCRAINCVQCRADIHHKMIENLYVCEEQRDQLHVDIDAIDFLCKLSPKDRLNKAKKGQQFLVISNWEVFTPLIPKSVK